MKRLVTCLAVAAIAAMFLTGAPEKAEAQKYYMDAFIAKYDAVAEAAKEKKCGVCHGKSKKMRSDYAKALAEALGAKKVKDKDKINAALEAVEKKDAGDGKTYGELLEAGKLPAPYEA
ncbi:hypothetical protein Mal4_50890 [Maioricimonas rarisocia]|uniref:Cytochrome c domain-containing protein n=1 Tax=Maioricimonas rarisocia TaxID=2528026 RepID=A0A517ZE47_9PLAN|nr:hypothetical protein [Maioricimonas rarisocia]QDU40729.1 hypothetical protein Mal4_50890 [Maioricimonas rarisocia]